MREGDPGTGTPRGPPDSPLLRDSRRGNHTPLEGLVGWLQNVLHSHNRGRRGGGGGGEGPVDPVENRSSKKRFIDDLGWWPEKYRR